MAVPERQDPAAFTAQLAVGDPAAFEVLFQRYFSPLRRYVYGYLRSWPDAEDVVHDVFLQLWRRHRWLGAVRDLDAYLYHITRNQALNRLKHRGVEARWQARQDASATHPADTEQDVLVRERTAAILRAIDALPPRQREIILLRWRHQHTVGQIALLLGISPSTVEVHITRAHKHLRKVLADL